MFRESTLRSGYTVTSPCEAIHSYLKNNIGSLGGFVNFFEGIQRSLSRKSRSNELNNFNLSSSIYHNLPEPLLNLKGKVSEYCLGLLLEQSGETESCHDCGKTCSKFKNNFLLLCSHEIWSSTFYINSRWIIHDQNSNVDIRENENVGLHIGNDLLQIANMYQMAHPEKQQYVSRQTHNLSMKLQYPNVFPKFFLPAQAEIKV
jgi:hypothetical protein